MADGVAERGKRSPARSPQGREAAAQRGEGERSSREGAQPSEDRAGNGFRLGRSVATAALRLYQQAVSPWLGPACRYEPSCSQYALEAVERYGALRGGWLALRRVGRCHPLGGFGYDPVP